MIAFGPNDIGFIGAVSMAFPSYGLTAYWTLDEASGNPRVDRSGNGYTLSEGGGSVAAASGMTGDGASFDGSTLRWLGSSDAAFATSGSNITISAWINLNTVAVDQAILGKYTSGGSADGYKLFFQSVDDAFVFRSSDSNGPNEDQIVGTVNIDAGVWYHVVCGFDGLNHFLVINAGTRENDEGLAAGNSGNDFRIGSDNDGSIMNGVIDEVAVWIGVALTDAQIAAIYNSGSPRRN